MILTLRRPTGSMPLRERVFRSALAALLDEPDVWPRFGLVGPDCPGSHSDMDYGLLRRGAEPVAHFAATAFELGWTATGALDDFHRLRQLGVIAEGGMLEATRGVNTHKGGLFLLGLLSFALGQELRQNSRILLSNLFLRAAALSRLELIAELTSRRRSFSETYGEWAQRKYGLTGVRGLVIGGFRPLFDALDWLFNKAQGPIGLLHGQLRLQFLAHCEDTNIVKRVGLSKALAFRHEAIQALEAGGVFRSSGLLRVRRLEDRMLGSRCSAAASGDMLILVIFFEGLGRHGFCNWQGHPEGAGRKI
jgi:triphosphoribosyl-dephospho-CoA synthetase